MAQLRREGKQLVDGIAALREPVERRELRLNITEPDFRPVGLKVIDDLEAFSNAKEGWQVADDNREGIRVSCREGNGWFLLRLSVHDPVMPLNLESDRPGGVDEMLKGLRAFFADVKGLDLSALA